MHAQEQAVQFSIPLKYNPEYRQNDFEKIILKWSVDTDIENLYLFNYADNEGVDLNPNEKYKLKISLDYKFLGLYVSFAPGFLPGNNDDDEKGSTSLLDLSFKFFYSDRLRQEVVYKKAKGFHELDEDGTLRVYPSTRVNTYGGKTFYMLNRNFSYRAYDNQTERQLKSAGSFIPSLSYYLRKIKTDHANSALFMNEFKAYDIFFQFGYMYNFVIKKKITLTLGLHPGLGYNYSTLSYNKEVHPDKNSEAMHSVTFPLDGNVSAMYSGKRLFIGLRSNLRFYEHLKENNSSLVTSKSFLEFYLGYRFKAPKRIKKYFDNLEDKYGL